MLTRFVAIAVAATSLTGCQAYLVRAQYAGEAKVRSQVEVAKLAAHSRMGWTLLKQREGQDIEAQHQQAFSKALQFRNPQEAAKEGYRIAGWYIAEKARLQASLDAELAVPNATEQVFEKALSPAYTDIDAMANAEQALVKEAAKHAAVGIVELGVQAAAARAAGPPKVEPQPTPAPVEPEPTNPAEDN